MKRITIPVTEATANALIKLARYGTIKVRTNDDLSAFTIARAIRPTRIRGPHKGGRHFSVEVEGDHEHYFISPDFKLT